MNHWKSIWNWVSTGLTVCLLIAAIYCVIGVSQQRKTGELFFPLGYRFVKILSGSMEDTLQTGALVIVKQTKEVEEGDIIFFITEEGTPVIHRYIATDSSGNMITKGDNNPKEDLSPVRRDQLQGKVVVRMNWLAKPFSQS